MLILRELYLEAQNVFLSTSRSSKLEQEEGKPKLFSFKAGLLDDWTRDEGTGATL